MTYEITFDEMQAELSRIKRNAKKNGQVTRSQAYDRILKRKSALRIAELEYESRRDHKPIVDTKRHT